MSVSLLIASHCALTSVAATMVLPHRDTPPLLSRILEVTASILSSSGSRGRKEESNLGNLYSCPITNIIFKFGCLAFSLLLLGLRYG